MSMITPAKPAFGGGGEKCEGCGKRVYPNEKVAAQNKAWHKGCFKCTECRSVLTVNSGYAFEGTHQPSALSSVVTYHVSLTLTTDKPYCKMHYTKLAGGRM